MSTPGSTHRLERMPLRLSLEVKDLLELVIENASAGPVRVWEFHNSWGWPTVSVLVRQGRGEAVHAIRRAQREWTKNAPTFIILAPSQRLPVPVDLHDGWWDRGDIPPEWRDLHFEVRVRYEVNPSPEAESLVVLVGVAESAWVAARPPHPWLFPPEREE